MREKAVVILSGGVDSTTLLYDVNSTALYDVYALTFEYGQKHFREVLSAYEICRELALPHKVINLSGSQCELLSGSALTDADKKIPEGHYEDEGMKLTVVPNRNMIFLSLAIAYALNVGATRVYYGAHSGDHVIYPDCRPEFIRAMQKAALLCDWKKMLVKAPYMRMSKSDIVKLGKKLEVRYDLTWTCYEGADVPCKKCGACIERAEAFADAGLEDPIL